MKCWFFGITGPCSSVNQNSIPVEDHYLLYKQSQNGCTQTAFSLTTVPRQPEDGVW